MIRWLGLGTTGRHETGASHALEAKPRLTLNTRTESPGFRTGTASAVGSASREPRARVRPPTRVPKGKKRATRGRHNTPSQDDLRHQARLAGGRVGPQSHPTLDAGFLRNPKPPNRHALRRRYMSELSGIWPPFCGPRGANATRYPVGGQRLPTRAAPSQAGTSPSRIVLRHPSPSDQGFGAG